MKEKKTNWTKKVRSRAGIGLKVRGGAGWSEVCGLKSIVSARAWRRKGLHGLSRHQCHDWAHDESMGSVGLKRFKFSTKSTASVC